MPAEGVPRGTAAAVRKLTAADRMPAGMSGREFVQYAGGRQAAVRALSGMDGPAGRRSNYSSEADWQAARTRWRDASRNVQRWTKEGEGEKRGGRPVEHLTPTQRRRVQAANREHKREEIRRRGIVVRRSGWFDSPNNRDRGGRQRTIGIHEPVVITNADEILDALAEGDRAAAEELLWLGFLDALGIPAEYMSVTGGAWEIVSDAA